MNPTVISETKDYLILNKPAGLVVHGDGKSKEGTLADWLLENYPKIKEVGEPWVNQNGDKKGETIYRPGIVHRLDRDTTGVMVIAKTQEMYEHLKQQFKDRDIGKKYEAFAYGNIKENKGTIDRSIGRSKSDFRKWSAQRGARGEMRQAITNFKVLMRTPQVTHVSIEPQTGRTHQIRVHFKAINHPLVHDQLYAPSQPALLGFTRTALHAKEIEFTDLKGKEVVFTAPYPRDFEHALAAIRSLC
jgi:23S rRNA pseudouridine1911/1915/1917 synthase